MKYTLMFVGILIALSVWTCKAATTNPKADPKVNYKHRKLIERSMRKEEHPCDDFYTYACGSWSKVYKNAGEEYNDPISMLDYNVNQEMSQAFNRFSMQNKPRFIREAYHYYKSCNSLSKYESKKYLMWLKANENLKWPALWTKPKNDTQFDWVLTLSKMRTYGFNNVFIFQDFLPVTNAAERVMIYLNKPEDFQPLTKLHLKFLIESLPGQITSESLDNLWGEFVEFEQKLQELDKIEDVKVGDEDFEKIRFRYVKDLPFDWLKDYVKIILNQTVLNDQMEAHIQNVPYMKALDQLIKSHSQRFLCKYLEIRFLWHLRTTGLKDFRDNDCLASVRSLMPTAMQWQYEQLHPELQLEYASINEIFNNIRKQFNNTIIQNKHGFNNTVIQFLQNKINNINLRLNNIPRVDTIDPLEEFYQPLKLDSKKFYKNHLKLLRFNFIARRNLLLNIFGLTYVKSSEKHSDTSPYFVHDSNTLFVPLTLLRLPIYSPVFEDVYKYSSLGFLLAHEMVNSFETNSIEFRENPLFNVNLNCLAEINPLAKNDINTDISGLRYAYRAFLDLHPEASSKIIYFNGGEIFLSKLFFLNFAQNFCGDSNEIVDALSEHDLGWDRVTYALSHFPEFRNEFKCKATQFFYPPETCLL